MTTSVWFDGLLAGLLPTVHGGADSAGGGLLGLIETVLGSLTNLIEASEEIVLFPGIRLLAANLHPLVVHFPIAFLAVFLLMELAGLVLHRPGLRTVASWMLYLGAIGAALAAVAGLIAAAEVPHGGEVHEIMEWHRRLMLTVTGLAVLLALWRAIAGVMSTAMALGLQLFLAVVMTSLMLFGTDLGGLMVYRYGVGVASLQGHQGAEQHLHTSSQEDD